MGRLFARAALALAIGGAAVYAHVRLIHPSNGNALWWNTPGNIWIVINDQGSDDISDGSHETALRNAIEEWNGVSGTSLNLNENQSAAAQARTDWGSDSIHLLYFDESNESGYFPGGSSTVAITPVWFYSNGRIADADVLFNGSGFQFTTSQQAGRFDVQDVAVHEIGHLIGLDHTGWAGGSMFPYVDDTVILHRSISEDERHGLRTAYPSGSLGSATGTVRRGSDDSPVAGAHVVLRDAGGRTAAGGLTNTSGGFDLRGLSAGTYDLYVTPLDYPVSAANLGSGWTIQTDFESTLHGAVVVGAGATAVGDVHVGANVAISLGRSADRYPLRAPSGETTNLVVRGSGLNVGSSLSASDPAVTVVPTGWLGSQVSFQVTVPGGATPGHVDLVVTNGGGDTSILPAALEITPPDPTVSLVSPNQGDVVGGTAVTISGTGFRAGARVVLGSEIYEDGAPGGCTVVNSTTITLVTNSAEEGIEDVVVVDATGVEGRQAGAFQYLAVPVVVSVYPDVGQTSGNTELRILGANFDVACEVRINGVVQNAVFPVSEEVLAVFTEPGTAGGPYLLEIENPSGAVATAGYRYVATPDPDITTISPNQGTTGGGDMITISGSNFGPNTTVYFGTDPVSGLGGTPAASLNLVDPNTLEVETPSHGAGWTSVVATDTGTGQVVVLSSGFQYQSSGGSGGGGGCHTVPVQGPPDIEELLRSLAFFALVALGLRVVGRAARPAPARAVVARRLQQG